MMCAVPNREQEAESAVLAADQVREIRLYAIGHHDNSLGPEAPPCFACQVHSLVESHEALRGRADRLEQALDEFFAMAGDSPRVCWDSFCGGGSHTALCRATFVLYRARAAAVSVCADSRKEEPGDE